MKNTLQRLEFSEDEAFALLTLAMSSNIELDAVSEKAVAKLAKYCRNKQSINHSSGLMDTQELCGAG